MPRTGQKIQRLPQADFAKAVAWCMENKDELNLASRQMFKTKVANGTGLKLHTKAINHIAEACGIELGVVVRERRKHKVPKSYHNRLRLLSGYVLRLHQEMAGFYLAMGQKDLPPFLKEVPEKLRMLASGRRLARQDLETELAS